MPKSFVHLDVRPCFPNFDTFLIKKLETKMQQPYGMLVYSFNFVIPWQLFHSASGMSQFVNGVKSIRKLWIEVLKRFLSPTDFFPLYMKSVVSGPYSQVWSIQAPDCSVKGPQNLNTLLHIKPISLASVVCPWMRLFEKSIWNNIWTEVRQSS
jgi:hypothetical protein